MKLKLFLTLIVGMSIYPVYAQDAENVPAPQADECEEAITLFQDVSGLGRKDRAAENMTKRHAQMAELGWRFVDMEVYTENGDLEGFYISYTRSAGCQKTMKTGN